MKKFSFVTIGLFLLHFSFAQQIDVYPTNWWVGMKNPRLQLMLHANNIGSGSAATVSYPGVTILKVFQPENPNYLFIDLLINASAKPGTLRIKLNSGEAFSFELKQRRKGKGSAYAKGVGSSDFVYLIMPDRFSNGDESNDRVAGMKDQSLNRDSMYHRHGGDIQGVINHLDYLKDLGITTVWLTPILENDMPNRTEHGYAITNHYKVDARHGGNQAYLHLSDELHKRGMKLMQDAVYNHCGLYNFFIQDMPMKDWVHQWPNYTQTNYRDQTIFDPHASEADRKKLLDGWFTRQMPDLNQSNPFVENFLIQHAIWSVEEFGVDGWRIDTYIYVDPEFMNLCNQALIDEYPKMTMVGEAWVHGTANEAYFTRNNLNTPFKSNATGVIDFQCLFDGIQPALAEHSDGGEHLYQTLSNDFLYKNPLNNLIFLDNHDMTRVYSQVKEDINKLKMGIGWLLTERGTPEMYYGTEILLKGISNPDGLVRGDFPGGWKEDKANKFTTEGRTEQENEVFNWTRTIANYRKHTGALKNGSLMQFIPEHGTYTYFRYNNDKTVMVVMNFTENERTILTDRFAERIAHYTKAKNIVTADVKDLKGEWQIPAKTIWIMELQK
ncbi:MAG TPA: glycoside hydrolase family 13 protein [Flavisolibacter sp.]|nr:glycoside hydrolase family 13 protein [Flavisolibacter sp.]